MEKDFHSGTIKKSITIRTTSEKTWKVISKITDLRWLDNFKSARFSTGKKRGIGARRIISFLDGTIVNEIIIGWRPKKYFSYIATSGLPLRGYHATISITNNRNKSVNVEWESYFSSELITKQEFDEFSNFLENFYYVSLKNLKNVLEN